LCLDDPASPNQVANTSACIYSTT